MAKSPTPLTSLASVAKYFDVAPRTVATWKAQGMPVGRPYDVAAIAAWRKENAKRGGKEQGDKRLELLDLDAELKRIKAAKLRGELVDAATVQRLLVRHINEAKTIFAQLPDRVAALLPAKTLAKVKGEIRAGVQRIVADTCQALADALAAPEFAGRGQGAEAE
jgi:phage terminase Nu1 subunit (DNA packaging protein)